MTRDEIMSLEPGRDLNMLVATKVMGWKYNEDYFESMGEIKRGPFAEKFDPSSDISAAWEVVEKLQESHLYVDIRTCADFYEVWITDWNMQDKTETIAHPTLPLVIARCALLTTLSEGSKTP